MPPAGEFPGPGQRRRRKITAKDRATFLDHLRQGWRVTAAAERAGNVKRRFYDLRAGDPEFAREWAEANAEGCDVLEDEAIRRATEGTWEIEEDGAGNVIRRRHRKSDALLARVLQAKIPAKYGDRHQIELHTQPTRIILESAFSPLPADVDGEARELEPEAAAEPPPALEPWKDGLRDDVARSEVAAASGADLEEPLRGRSLDRFQHREER